MIETHGTSREDPAQFAEMDQRTLVLAGGRERGVSGHTSLVSAGGLRVAAERTIPLGHVVLDCVPRPATGSPA